MYEDQAQTSEAKPLLNTLVDLTHIWWGKGRTPTFHHRLVGFLCIFTYGCVTIADYLSLGVTYTWNNTEIRCTVIKRRRGETDKEEK